MKATVPPVDQADYEVNVPVLKLQDPQGRWHKLRRGTQVPEWVSAEARAEMVANRAVLKFGVI